MVNPTDSIEYIQLKRMYMSAVAMIMALVELQGGTVSVDPWVLADVSLDSKYSLIRWDDQVENKIILKVEKK